MSPALRLKSIDRKPEKEVSSHSSKPSSQTLKATVPPAAPRPSNVNRSHYQNPDDADDQDVNLSWEDNDSISNGDSWSVESEGHREKSSQQPVPQPDLSASDRREKIRQKNEKKHQRQKEKRARELQEQCCALLMSRKLEALAQQLVSMGFSHERATEALILNEGRVEESVAWILEGNKEDKHSELSINCRNKLKMDISEELTRIKTFETRYMASKQVVERAVVACAGDLDKVEEKLRPKSEDEQEQEPGDPPTVHVQKSLTGMQQGLPSSIPQPVSMLVERRQASPQLNISTALPTAVSNSEPQYFPVSNGIPFLQLGTVKPGIYMQQHLTPGPKLAPTVSVGSSPGVAKDWIQNSLETMQRSRGVVGSNMSYSDVKRPQLWESSSSSSIDPSSRTAQGNVMVPKLRRPAASLGLFARHKTSVPLDPMDIRNVDWSIDEGALSSLSPLRPGGFMNSRPYDEMGYQGSWSSNPGLCDRTMLVKEEEDPRLVGWRYV